MSIFLWLLYFCHIINGFGIAPARPKACSQAILVRYPCRFKAVIVKDTLHLSLWRVVFVVSTRICPLLFSYNLLASLIVSFREKPKSR